MEDNTNDTKAPRWPYTSFKTLLNFILRLEENKAIPPRIDRSILPGSEGQKTQVLAALKFLGLVTDSGDVTPLMQRLVMEEKERPKIIRELLQKHYPAATQLAGVHATSKQLEETFSGLTGDTLRKAMTFYLHAAKFSNHPVSKNFKVPSGFSRRPRTPRARADAPPPPSVMPPVNAPSVDAKSRYLDMLLEKAAKDDKLDSELANRIEKLLGFKSEDGE